MSAARAVRVRGRGESLGRGFSQAGGGHPCPVDNTAEGRVEGGVGGRGDLVEGDVGGW